MPKPAVEIYEAVMKQVRFFQSYCHRLPQCGMNKAGAVRETACGLCSYAFLNSLNDRKEDKFLNHHA